MTPVLVRRSTFAFSVAILTGVACSDSTSPSKPASIAPTQGAVAEGTVGTVLTSSPTFEVKDESGKDLGGVAVTITVTAGGGTLTSPPATSAAGPTSVGTWKLGNTAGVNSVTVSAAGLTPIVISVNGKAGPPAAVVYIAGQNQSGLAGTVLPVTPVAQVRDQFGNPVSGAPVTFVVLEGGGDAAGNPVTTDASGNASAPTWTLGKSATPQTLRAVTQGGAAAALSATVSTSYNVDLRFFGPAMPAATSAMFRAAAARISGAIVGDVPDLPAQTTPVDLASICGVDGLPTAFTEGIDDILIYASVGPIDGPKNILAFAGPCAVRGTSGSTGRQSLLGVMKFDSEDLDSLVAQGTLTDVIQHEMLHVVGFGTLWSIYGILADAGTTSTRFTGAFGINGCIQIGGSTICPDGVPLENTGGAGTRDSHWRESVFGPELMTGFVTHPTPGFTGILNPLSVMTIQSFADLGYATNPKAADPFIIPGQSAIRGLGQLNVDQSSSSPWEQVITPKLQTNRRGQLVLIPKQ